MCQGKKNIKKGKEMRMILVVSFIIPFIIFSQNNRILISETDFKITEPALETLKRKEMPLEKYNFLREEYKADNQKLLMGNGEMGGWVSNDGLGFEKLWFTDLWENDKARKFLHGPKLTIKNKGYQKDNLNNYRSELNLRNGVLSTSVSSNQSKYNSYIFFSKKNKRVLTIYVENKSQKDTLYFDLLLPNLDSKPYQIGTYKLTGSSTRENEFTHAAWNLRSTSPLLKLENKYSLVVAPEQDVTILYSLVTHFDSENYTQLSIKNTDGLTDIKTLLRTHNTLWEKQWKSIGSIILPEGENAKWFYRSLYTLYATSGANKFLPGELQFSVPDADWKMHSFTYGYSGWAVWCYAVLGDQESAEKMARWHYKPIALKKNVKTLFPKIGPVEVIYKNQNKGYHTYIESYNPEAIAFGHEVTTDGYNITYPSGQWDMQRQLDAFSASFFHVISKYYPDQQFYQKYTYPVLKGTAEMWSSLVKWDDNKKHYYLPPLLSVSENIMEKSVLDAVLAAKWNLKVAIQNASELGEDKELITRWQHIFDNLYIPQNKDIYLEYLKDDQSRKGGGYFGIRAYTYFGFPALETIEDINLNKARKSLDIAWNRNDKGDGMITFIMSWFALTETYLGYGNKAYKISNMVTTVKDKSGVALYEYGKKQKDGSIIGNNPYFLTGYASFILSQVSMIVQSYDNIIKVFPALPDHWKNIEFYDLPVQNGIKISGILKDGKSNSIALKKGDKLIIKKIKTIPTVFEIGH